MNLTRNRKLKRFSNITRGMIGRNIVLYSGLMLPYIVMPVVNLKTAVALTIAMLFSLLFGMAACYLVSSKSDLVRYIAVTATALGGVAVSRFVIRFISSEIFDTMGIYLPLMAVNSIVLLYVAQHTGRNKVLHLFWRGIASVIGFGLVACIVGIVRELLLSGSVWGTPVASISFPAAGMVFFGFILLAFLGAAVQALRRCLMAFYLRLDNPTAEELLRRQEERMVD